MKIAPATLRAARADDAEAIVGVLADDTMGGHGDEWRADTAEAYRSAMAEILAHPDHRLWVAETEEGVVGMLHLAAYRVFTDLGAKRAQITTWFVLGRCRGQGIGARLVAAAEAEARAMGARFVVLTSNKARTDAHRFYRTLGYDQRHEGFKKDLSKAP